MRITVTETPLHHRLFEGFGLECDPVIYNVVNAAAGVRDKDIELIERRLRAIRPSLARMFFTVDWVNPTRDGKDFCWDSPDYLNFVRLLRLLQEIGARVNVVLFSPMWSLPREAYPPLVDATGRMLLRLREHEGIDAVRFLIVYNEPESCFNLDSPLARRIFGDERVQKSPGYDTWLELAHQAQAMLEEHRLYPHVKLAAPDCVYGSPMRYECMRRVAPVFAEMDITWAVHVYSPENQDFYEPDPVHRSNWGYPGMAKEAADFRELAGPDKPMILWEYNLEGMGGHTPFFTGVNRHGVSQMETIDTGPEILHKTFLAVNNGYDGACLWTLCDIFYGKGNLMTMGLWRFKNAQWYPRPHYYYYAPLCQLFRPGMRILRVDGCEEPVFALAARGEEETVLALLNVSAETRQVELKLPGAKRCLRVYPDKFPPRGADLPYDDWEDCAAGTLTLTPRETLFVRTGA